MSVTYDSMRRMWPLPVWPVAALLGVTVGALLFRHALFLGFRRWTGHTYEQSLFLQAVRFPSILWCVVLGLFRRHRDRRSAAAAGGADPGRARGRDHPVGDDHRRGRARLAG